MLRVAQWARVRLDAYQTALAAAGGCDVPQTGRLPPDGYQRLFSASGLAFPGNRGAGACASQPIKGGDDSIRAKMATAGTATVDAATVDAATVDAATVSDAVDDKVAGGARRRPGPKRHIVVDTLNILHVLGKKPSAKAIVETIDAVAPALRKGDPGLPDGGYPGRIMFVVKDRETAHLDAAAQAAYAEAAARNRSYVYAVERYRVAPCVSAIEEPGARTAATREPRHSVRSRDDFYAAVLAERWGAPVLTADRFRDFAEWRRTLAPFHVDEYAFSVPPGTPPVRYFVNPKGGAYERLKPPAAVRPCQAISSLLPVKC